MKKIPFVIIKKSYIFAVAVFVIVAVFFAFVPKIVSSTSPKGAYTVVIDAGHGGIDGGCQGKTTGVTEAVLNLEYSKCLRDMMQNFGFDVVMTRSTESGLYNPLASNKKKDDMKKRQQVVENSNADFVISIHMNSFNSTSCGAQVFYDQNDEPSKNLAQNIQKHFLQNLKYSRSEIKTGDYFMLNQINAPSVLVECGFLSNPKEEALLITEEYKNELCYSILLGVLEYLR